MNNEIEFKRDSLFLEKILEISDDGFIMADKNGYIIDINKSYCDYLGLNKKDIVGKYVRDIIKNSKLPHIIKSGETEVAVLHKLAKNQSPTKEKYVVVSRACVKDKDERVGAVGQVKFSRNTIRLASKLNDMDDELQYYKSELKRIVESSFSFDNIVGKDEEFLKIKRIAKKSTKNDITVLITGETGTGKEVFANAIHYESSRRKNPFIRVNCAAIPGELLESELFGYVEGAFTGAKKGGKKGKFELANGGTIFLDEIGDMSIKMQAKLLRALQEREIEKVGASKPIKIDVRIIAATNKDLLEEVKKDNFREDLYYRLNVIRLEIPPLRDRKEDIISFIEYFLEELNNKYKSKVRVSDEVKRILKTYEWSGNIRELKNVIYNAYNMMEGSVIKRDDLPYYLKYKSNLNKIHSSNNNFFSLVEGFEKEIIVSELRSNNYNCVQTAKKLGIHRSTLYKKIDKYNIMI